MKKITQFFYIFILVVFLVLPIPAYRLFGGMLDEVNHEKRELAQRPVLTAETIQTFPSAYEHFLNDNMPFKQILAGWNGMLDYFVFRTSSSDDVIVGKGGWLFYKGKQANNEDPEADYRGENLFTQQELEKVRDNMLAARDLLRERGTKFIIFIAPNKARVYSEYMPAAYGAPAQESRMMQVVNYLQETTDLHVVCPYEELMEFKEKHPEISLYYKYDTHWNNAGAYIAARELADELDYEMPRLEDLNLSQNPDGKYDLAELLGLQEILRKDPVWIVNGYTDKEVEVHKNEGLTEFRFWNQDDEWDDQKIFLVGDSFSTMMGPYIACHVLETYLNSYLYYESWMLATEDPDVLIYETVERYIGNMLDFDLTSHIGAGRGAAEATID